jgi:hypothetical protein
MKTSKAKRLFDPLLFLTALSLFLPFPGPLLLISGIVQAFVLPGLVILIFLGDKNRPWTDNIFFTLILSPVLLTLTVLLASRMTDDFNTAPRIAAGVYYILFALVIILKKDRFGVTISPIPSSVIILSACYGGFLTLMYFVNDFLLIRSDAWYHASVINEILTRGIPPMEPDLPDTPIRYMWIYHLFIASFKGLSGMSLFRAMSFLNIAGALSLPYLAARVISSFISSKRRIFASTLIVVAGLESASWIVWPVFLIRAFTGEVRGMEEVRRLFQEISFRGQGPLYFLRPFGTWMVNLNDKFITITPFGFSLDLFLLCFIMFISGSFIRDSKIKALIIFFIISLGTFLFHIITGTALICTLIGAGVLLPVIKMYIAGEKDISLSGIIPAVAAIAAALIGIPYFLSLGGGAAEGGSPFSGIIHIGVKNMATIILPLLILFCPAWRAIKKVFSANTNEYAIIAAWIVPLLLLNLFVDLPTRNESKLIYPLFLLLGAVVSIEIVDMIAGSTRRRKIVLIAWILILFLVPPILTFRGFLIAAADDSEVLIARYSQYKGEKEIYEWVMANTSRNSIIMERNLNHLMPVFAGRRNFAGKSTLWKVLGYDREYVTNQYDLNRDLYACDSIPAGTLDSIRNTGLDLYVAVFASDIKECPDLGSRFDEMDGYFELVYSDKNGRLYHLK